MRIKTLFTQLVLLAVLTLPAAAQTKLLRFPDVHGEEVVFCYAGDIWKASTDGGTATRLTAHPGQELFPRFSPDGKWIAFTAQYEGDEQVYVVASSGGIPKQLTYYPARGPLAPRWGYDNQVYGWTPDGSRILFRSLRDADGGKTLTALYTVGLEGGLPEKLPMPTSGAGDFAPDGERLVYSPLFRDFRTWKRYQGGWAQDLYIFDLDSHEVKLIAQSDRTERDPMWIGDKVYFVSDRDGTLNLYAYGISSGSVDSLTDSETWDVRWPSSDNERRIVYEFNGELHLFDVEENASRKLSIFVPDEGLAKRPSRYSAAENIEDFELSPSGERALFVARGDVFTVPVEKGPTRNLTDSSSAHDKHARWSPDGRKIAFISDMSGEEQLYLIDQDGSGEPEQLTSNFEMMLYPPAWSPTGEHLAFSDKNGRLHVLTLEDLSLIEVADDEFGGISDYSWAPDGRWLAFSMADRNDFRSIYIWSAQENQLRRITDEYFNEYDPEWGRHGDYLYYLSDREFSPQISLTEWNFAGNRTTGVYAMALRKDVADPFPPQSDEVEIEEAASEESAETETAPAEEESTEDKDIEIDFEGLAARVSKIPFDFHNLNGLSVAEAGLLFASYPAPYYGRSVGDTKLHFFDLKERKAGVLSEDISGYALSSDGTRVLIREGSSYNLYDARADGGQKKTVSTSDMMVNRVPVDEWAQIFDEVWRRYRDFFYVRNMHGYDWEAIGNRYRTLIPYVAHRSDLNYLIGEMIAELNVGHAYIQGGDYEIPDRPRVGLPGARFELDSETGRYRLSKIFEGDNEEPRYRAPLSEIGIDVSTGEYVLAINGEELRGSDNPYRLLRHQTDPIRLTVNSEPAFDGAREVTYRPVFSEASLLYLEWVSDNRQKVSEMTDGRVGYLHIPDMGATGIYEFIKWFYPQIRKEGLVIDVRSNGGGNVSQWIIERLDTELLGTRFGYASDEPRTYPYTVFHGHMVCLIDQTSASDGDIFPHRFRKAGLGPLIGKRTWGGVVGISSRGPLIDGGTVYVPLQGTNDVDGSWIIEGEGVSPDIEVDNDPASVIAGEDPQLERGVEEVLNRIAEDPKRLPERPDDPVKTP